MLLLARISHIALIIAAIGGFWWLEPQQTTVSADTMLRAGILLSLLAYGPLLLLLPATIKGDGRLLTWLCILLLFYFAGFSVQLFDPPPVQTLAIIRVALTTLLFVSAVMVIRQRGTGRD
ncbi:DUF2069 domain-containing protein [Alcanivorax sp. 1008]|uniref:DUF2069 domain-containing protein n=1 Tax=Alcanivorax sp. 1008 TaxID=2816853 RepID=UPI001E4DF4DB|nr:DUF2069 domain-containing protein [Alcanivorax sp. 1008]